jgi:hypothetical protein
MKDFLKHIDSTLKLPDVGISFAAKRDDYWLCGIRYGDSEDSDTYLYVRRYGPSMEAAYMAAWAAFSIAFHYGLDEAGLERQARAAGPAP